MATQPLFRSDGIPVAWVARGVLLSAGLGLLLASYHLYARLGQAGGTGPPSLRKLLTDPKQHKRLDSNPFPDAYYVPWLEGMEQLDEAYAPTSPAWDNSIAICSIMKDENVTDVREWITYYRWLGVDHIFLTDNNSEGGKDIAEQLASEFPASFLTVQLEEAEHAQMKAYAWCAEEQRMNYNWIGFFDLDEFLFVRDGVELHTFLDSYKQYAALSVHWIWMGPDGRAHRPKSGGVLPYYTMCSAQPDKHIKTIVNTYFLDGLTVHPHNFHYRDEANSVDENFQEILPMWKGKPEFKRAGGTDNDCGVMGERKAPGYEKKCFLSAGALGDPAAANKVALYHYATKSLEDFSDKMHRGSGMSKGSKGMDYFAEISRLQTRSEWCRYPSAAALQCCSALYPEVVAGSSAQGTLTQLAP